MKNRKEKMKADKISYSRSVLRSILSFILLASLLILPNSGCNRNMIGGVFKVDQLVYVVVTEDTVSVRAWPTISGDIVIPASVTNGGINYSVAFLDEGAFMECSSLTSITIPGSVTSISDFAFMECSSLKSITIPGSVTSIGVAALSQCGSLTSITIPDSVTSISMDAFSQCGSLTEIVIDNNNPNFSSLDGVLFNKDQTRLIQCPGGKSGAYSVPDSVTSISKAAFQECSSLTSITIPNSVTSIGDFAFLSCSKLTEIVVDNNNPNFSSLDGVLFNKAQTALIQYPDGKSGAYTPPHSVTSIGQAVFGRSSLTNIVIPDDITSIGWDAFRDCSNLTSVKIGKSVTSIGTRAFYGCSSLTSIEIPDNVTSIDFLAFGGCSSLKSVTIGNGVTTISEGAFYECGKLTDVYFKGNAPKLPGECAFFEPSVIYYKPGTTGWTNPWYGRPTKEWVE